MAFNGSGVFNRLYSWVTDAANSIKIRSQKMDDEMNGFATGLTNCITKDGQSTPTANIPMGSFKFTTLAVGTASTDSITLGQAQNSGFLHIGSISGTDTITGTLSPAITAYATGQRFSFVSAGANTGAVTINLNSVGAKSITKKGTTALAAGDIPSGAMVEMVYDGTQFQIINIGTMLVTADIGSSVQAYDADTLKADTSDTLTAGFKDTVYDNGTQSSGTLTPDAANGNSQKFVNGGAFTLAPPSDSCTLILQQTNNASAGTITTSGFTVVDGDSLTTTNGDDFLLYITKSGTFSLLTVKALQ